MNNYFLPINIEHKKNNITCVDRNYLQQAQKCGGIKTLKL